MISSSIKSSSSSSKEISEETETSCCDSFSANTAPNASPSISSSSSLVGCSASSASDSLNDSLRCCASSFSASILSSSISIEGSSTISVTSLSASNGALSSISSISLSTESTCVTASSVSSSAIIKVSVPSNSSTPKSTSIKSSSSSTSESRTPSSGDRSFVDKYGRMASLERARIPKSTECEFSSKRSKKYSIPLNASARACINKSAGLSCESTCFCKIFEQEREISAASICGTMTRVPRKFINRSAASPSSDKSVTFMYSTIFSLICSTKFLDSFSTTC